jgi:beta-lactamase regulating signal transducer with metallopeptidase domain
MTILLDTLGAAVWRASWQAGVLALLVMLLLRSLGERISPRWRYLLWSVVAIRLLVVTIPASPWSAFNLVHLIQDTSAPRIAVQEPVPTPAQVARSADRNTQSAPSLSDTWVPSQTRVDSVVKSRAPQTTTTAPSTPLSSAVALAPSPSVNREPRLPALTRILSSIWLAGCLLSALQLVGAAFVLHRRLAVCRPVTDAAVLELLDSACERAGLRRRPGLQVTPASISPCIAGTFKARIIVPEAIVTGWSSTELRHVLAHEIAHLLRGDLWTNWLLLAARTIHWFNPVAWWTVREMQAEREAACDETALAVLGERDRSRYAATIIELAANLAPSGIAPGMIGLIESPRRLTARIERLVACPAVPALRGPVAAGIVLTFALCGLTDAMPVITASQSPAQPAPVPEDREKTDARTVTIEGRCFDRADKTPLAGVDVRLFQARGRTAPIVEAARSVTDREGRFQFPGLTPPRPEDALDPLVYLIFALADDRPIGIGRWDGGDDEASVEIGIDREKTMLAGTVRNERGEPLAGATVAEWILDGRPVPGILSATTRPDGRFLITRISHDEWLRQGPRGGGGLNFSVVHPDYPETALSVLELPGVVTVTLETGCRITGQVIDSVTNRPAAGALVLAERLGKYSEFAASTDASGHFKITVPEDRYHISVRARDRVCVAITDRECLAGQTLGLPPFLLIKGGTITGRVMNASTGESISTSAQGRPIMLGLFGPSRPMGKVVNPLRMAAVDKAGRFTLRAAPGENFPYLVNYSGDRMGWNTTQQPAVVVKEGETTEYNMLVTPEVPPEEKLKSAGKLVDSLPKRPSDRTARILAEFRKLSHTVDDTELWCTLMRELVTIGHDAVPQVCGELDRTTEDLALRRLAFALRAIGDPRAVPALIRAIPRTLVPASSDYGLIVADAPLTAFMQQHDLTGRPQPSGRYFDLGRPPREIFGALHKLTAQDFDDSDVSRISLSADPRRQWYQHRLFTGQAQRWQAWWNAHGAELTDDAVYQKVNLQVDTGPLPPVVTDLHPKARLDDGVQGQVVSPASQEGQHTEYFYDLDTSASPRWPAHIPRDEARFDQKQLADWAAQTGVDLMCVTHRAPDGKRTFVLRSFGMKVWELSERDRRNIDKLIPAGTLPKGHDSGNLLMHYDASAKRFVPDANGAFIFVTREGCMGLIEVTDRVTETANLTGTTGDPPPGVGFKTGVRFNLRSIIP